MDYDHKIKYLEDNKLYNIYYEFLYMQRVSPLLSSTDQVVLLPVYHLLSLTLLIAYASNLILLPCFILSLEKSILRKEILNVSVIDIDEDDEEEN